MKNEELLDLIDVNQEDLENNNDNLREDYDPIVLDILDVLNR